MGATGASSRHAAQLKKLKRQKATYSSEIANAQARCVAVNARLSEIAAEYRNALKPLDDQLAAYFALFTMYESQVMQLEALEKAKAAEMKKGGNEKKIAKIEGSIKATAKACDTTHGELQTVWGRGGAFVDDIMKQSRKHL